MLSVVARLVDGSPFAQVATSPSHALALLRATEALVGDLNNVWVELDGKRIDAAEFRRTASLQNLPEGEPQIEQRAHDSVPRSQRTA
jgi:hypothetical protein